MCLLQRELVIHELRSNGILFLIYYCKKCAPKSFCPTLSQKLSVKVPYVGHTVSVTPPGGPLGIHFERHILAFSKTHCS